MCNMQQNLNLALYSLRKIFILCFIPICDEECLWSAWEAYTTSVTTQKDQLCSPTVCSAWTLQLVSFVEALLLFCLCTAVFFPSFFLTCTTWCVRLTMTKLTLDECSWLRGAGSFLYLYGVGKARLDVSNPLRETICQQANYIKTNFL